ncbi:hypothetical protein HK22_02155 [Gluconobacter sp. DsW_056]|nr:hypothetical protein HK22_02155 [Gluconobacter sp. DsW_056]
MSLAQFRKLNSHEGVLTFIEYHFVDLERLGESFVVINGIEQRSCSDKAVIEISSRPCFECVGEASICYLYSRYRDVRSDIGKSAICYEHDSLYIGVAAGIWIVDDLSF